MSLLSMRASLFTNNVNLFSFFCLGLKYRRSAANMIFDVVGSLSREARPSYPRLLNIFITNKCNLSCPMCLNSDFRHRKKYKELDIGLIRKILPELKRYKPLVYIVGGEPLMASGLLNLITMLGNIGLCTSFTTNGVQLEKFASQIVDSPLEFISISLDHFTATEHDAAKGVKGAFQRTIKGVEKLVELRKKQPSNIKINTVVLANNYDNLPEMFSFVESLGVDEWSIQHNSFITPTVSRKIDSYLRKTGIGSYCDGTRIEKKYFFAQEQIEVLRQGLDEVSDMASKSDIRVSLRPYCNDISAYYSGNFPGKDSSCSFPNYSLNIDEGGQVYSCLGYRLGNLEQNASIKEIWESKKTRDFQRRIMEEMPVPGCYRCCALNYKFSRKIKTPDK